MEPIGQFAYHSQIMSRRYRSIAACLTLFCVLFAQWAVAHHVVSNLSTFVQASGHGDAMVEVNCHDAEETNATSSKAMCKQHCESDTQSVVAGFDAAAFATFSVAYVLPMFATDLQQTGALPAVSADLVPHPPPLSRSANLRI